MSRHIGVAISGGGNRATLWGLGTLLYLVDAGKSAEVGAVSSVSGGSITNAYVAQELDLGETDTASFDAAMVPLVRDVATKGSHAWSPVPTWYVVADIGGALLGLLAMLAAVVLAFLDLGLGVTVPLLAGGFVVIVVALQVFELRSRMVERALARRYFAPDGRRTRLADIVRSVDHVICATELQSALHLYFAPRFVYTYRLGMGEPAELSLATAVQCSACLPVAFSARRLPAGQFRFVGGHPAPGQPGDVGHVVLSDGGVYDNMADQWFDGLGRRAHALGPRIANPGVDEVIVVNGSSPPGWSGLRRMLLAVVAEFATLARVNDVMYDVTTKVRRSALVEEWDEAAASGTGTRGALVHIAQSPYGAADAFRHDPRFPDRAARAEQVIAALGDTEASRQWWAAMAARSPLVPTVLRSLGREVTVDLLEHSYVLAMCNLHVILGYPLLPVPGRDRFERLLDGS
ncbi:MAG: patatin-like phospholipase family protein [Frankiaceae bacterium]